MSNRTIINSNRKMIMSALSTRFRVEMHKRNGKSTPYIWGDYDEIVAYLNKLSQIASLDCCADVRAKIVDFLDPLTMATAGVVLIRLSFHPVKDLAGIDETDASE